MTGERIFFVQPRSAYVRTMVIGSKDRPLLLSQAENCIHWTPLN